jgi:hypothetical protein
MVANLVVFVSFDMGYCWMSLDDHGDKRVDSAGKDIKFQVQGRVGRSKTEGAEAV